MALNLCNDLVPCNIETIIKTVVPLVFSKGLLLSGCLQLGQALPERWFCWQYEQTIWPVVQYLLELWSLLQKVHGRDFFAFSLKSFMSMSLTKLGSFWIVAISSLILFEAPIFVLNSNLILSISSSDRKSGLASRSLILDVMSFTSSIILVPNWSFFFNLIWFHSNMRVSLSMSQVASARKNPS